jgi:hypothetical protein
LLSACPSTTRLGFDFDASEIEPLDTALTLVVVAWAGGDRFEVAFPSVDCIDGDLFVFGFADRLTEESTSEAVVLADDMLSQATWVTGGALRGHVLLYQL